MFLIIIIIHSQAALKSEIVKKERELKVAEDELQELENRLTKLVKAIAVETEAIKQIEEQLEKGGFIAGWGYILCIHE